MDDQDAAPEPLAALPKEGERRHVEDADARGIEIVLQGGETWFVPAMPLSPRGTKIAELIDAIEDTEVDAQAAQHSETLAEKALLDATEDAAVEKARERLKSASRLRRAASKDLKVRHRELAYHALRAHYRLTREEVGLLVTQRHWADVVAALNGRDTAESQRRIAIDLMERMARITGKREGSADEVPFARASASATPAPS